MKIDLEKTIAELRSLMGYLHAHNGIGMEAVRNAVELLRAMRPLTTDEAFEVLNGSKYQGFDQWENTKLLSGGDDAEFELSAVAREITWRKAIGSPEGGAAC